MATIVEYLDAGVVIKCYECNAPIKLKCFRHRCDIRKGFQQLPAYCFQCIAEKGICKYCDLPHTAVVLINYTIRG